MVLIAEDAVIHFPRKLGNLPHSLRHIEYSVQGSPSTGTRIHINSKRSLFHDEIVEGMNSYLKRKIENLFIIAFPGEKMTIIFE